MNNNIILIHGNDFFLLRKEIEKQIPEESATNIIYAEEEDGSSIQNKLSMSGNLFGDSEIFKIYNFSKNKDFQKILDNIIQSREAIPHKLIFIETELLRSNSVLIKKISSIGVVKKIEKPTQRKIRPYVDQILNKYNIKLTEKQILALIARSNLDLETINNNVKKLYLLKQNITDEVFNKIIADNAENDIWDLLNEIFKANASPEQVIKILKNMMRYNLNIQLILFMLIKQLKTIADIKWFQNKGLSDNEILKQTHIHPFVYSKVKYFAQESTSQQIKFLMNKFILLDFKLKTSKVDNELGLLLLISYMFDK